MRMNLQEIDAYLNQEVESWLNRNNYSVSNHVKGIIKKILYVRCGVMDLRFESSFIKGIFKNDLHTVIAFGDADCIQNLKIIYSAYYNIELISVRDEQIID